MSIALVLTGAWPLVGCTKPQGPKPASAPNDTATTKAGHNFNTEIVPGKRFGSLTRETTRDDLAAVFGEGHLEDLNVAETEETAGAATRVNLGAGHSFTVIWTDTIPPRIQEIRDIGPRWKTPQGIGVGTSLASLESILGPVKFYGFGWQYSGVVLLENTKLGRYRKHLLIALGPKASSAMQTDTYLTLMGNEAYASDDPRVDELDLVVQALVVRFEPPTPHS